MPKLGVFDQTDTVYSQFAAEHKPRRTNQRIERWLVFLINGYDDPPGRLLFPGRP